jgi:hypothetical protein
MLSGSAQISLADGFPADNPLLHGQSMSPVDVTADTTQRVNATVPEIQQAVATINTLVNQTKQAISAFESQPVPIPSYGQIGSDPATQAASLQSLLTDALTKLADFQAELNNDVTLATQKMVGYDQEAGAQLTTLTQQT